MAYRKKLIEVALPLEAISQESAREKSIRHGHPSTLHLWWSRKPLAACRAVLFASLVDDPSCHPEKFPTEEAQEKERKRLFEIIENLVKWENVNNQQVLATAKAEVLKSTNGNPPPVYDPFCGGGSIPLEGQRLGLEAHGSDLNPVAVLITKASIEIPPKFANQPPINPDSRKKLLDTSRWYGAQGLAEDVRYYGKWMREHAYKQIGQLYPKVKLPSEYGGGEATVIAWLWAKTVKCPNPACGANMPLPSKFWLSTKKGKQAWIEPLIDRSQQPPIVRFEVKTGEGKPPDGTVNRKGAICICCSTPVPINYIRTEGKAGRMNAQLLAIVAEGQRQRVYLSPNKEHEEIARGATPKWQPDEPVATPSHDVDRLPMYGMYTWGDAFTPRQLVALTTFSELISEAREKIQRDAVAARMPDDSLPLSKGGTGASAYADAVATYLALGASKLSDYNSSLVIWSPTRDQAKATFARQALPMVWDYAEVNPFAQAAGDLVVSLKGMTEALEKGLPLSVSGTSRQLDATTTVEGVTRPLISTDPPYFDNVGYSDLSDYFYVWLRRSLSNIYSNLFRTLLTPKTEELIVAPHRFGGNKKKAQEFFQEGLGKAFARMCEVAHPDYPLTVYYAFKQAETEDDEHGKNNSVIASTGWETMLEGLIQAGFSINGTWPMRTERSARSSAIGTNALASSIVLVCRPRPESAPSTTRRQFLTTLKRELPQALKTLQQGNIAPVDLAQASIGPGMAVFSRYAKVLEADGSAIRWLETSPAMD
jgi:putative DNA methylase